MRTKKYWTEFTVETVSSFDGMTTTLFVEKTKEPFPNPFTVRANQTGVWFHGALQAKLSTQDDFEKFAELVGEAASEHVRLRPKISRTLSGH